MNVEQVLNEFKKSGALLEGHFILSSGLHSDKFLQKALVFQDAKRTAKLCKALAAKVKAEVKDEITAIVSPAVGGIVPGYEMGRQLGLPAMYVERVDGEFQLRRNFTLKKGQKVLMVEDIVSTGVSSRECIAAIKKTGAKVVARNPLFFEFVMDIEVRDVAHLQNIVGALRVNNAVESVDRVREADASPAQELG